MAKTGRNDPCPCGSGKKYKHCCLGREACSAPTSQPGKAAEPELARWKEADARLIRQGMAMIDRGAVDLDRAAEEFFGSFQALRQLMTSERGEMVSQQFHDWVWMDYRPSRHQPTIAERLLDSGRLAADERSILEAKIPCPISLYQAVEVQPGRSVVLEDLWREQRVEVVDIMLSQSIPRYIAFPARVYSAGPYFFISGLGALIHPSWIPETLEWLTSHGLSDMSAASLRAHCYLFGRLWSVVSEWERRPIQLTNTDGEPLALCTARFEVNDREALHTALVGREDIVEDPEAGEWVWQGATQGMGEGVTLARLRLNRGKLSVEVNSRERLRRVKAWLGKIPGLHHVGDQIKSAEELRATLRAGEPNQPVREEIPPELAELARQEIARRYETWPDTPLPALDGRTPRAAVRTEAGRREVILLLRQMAYRLEPGEENVPEYDFNILRRALGLPEE